MIDIGKVFGRSMAFPARLNGEQRLAWSEAEENIRESIQIILSTEPGERLMLPDFGAGLKKYLSEPNTISTHRLMEESIHYALVVWEPRVKLQSIDIVEDEDDPFACWVFIRYELVANKQPDQVQLKVRLTG